MSLLIVITSIFTAIWLVNQIPMDWIEDLFASFGIERYAIVGKIVVGLIVFCIGYTLGVYVFWFCIIVLFFLMLKK